MQGFLISGTPVFMAEFLKGQGAIIDRAGRDSARRQPNPELAEVQMKIHRAIGQSMVQSAEEYKLPEALEGDAEAKTRLESAIAEIMALPREHIMLKRAMIVAPMGDKRTFPSGADDWSMLRAGATAQRWSVSTRASTPTIWNKLCPPNKPPV